MNESVQVHYFYSTGDAYDACQCSEVIKDGDVLVIPEENVVGLAHTWPFALTKERGQLHRMKEGVEPRGIIEDLKDETLVLTEVLVEHYNKAAEQKAAKDEETE